ncbi:MAG TPA: hypothetical protein VK607_19955, partial [Kofleriaceae bacterium]|nr:hypothetical protein [Kofleriaceae bacterium]
MQPLVIPRSSLRRAVLASVVLHAAAAVLAGWLIVPVRASRSALVDIEVAPAVPLPEALPRELARPPRELTRRDQPEPEPASTAPDPASGAPDQPGEALVDAGIDAAPDARPDAAPDARPDAMPDARPDAMPDAGAPDAMIVAGAELDAGVGDAGPEVAAIDGGGDASQVAATPADAGEPLASAGSAAEADAGAAGSAAGSAEQVAGAGSAGSAAGSDAIATGRNLGGLSGLSSLFPSSAGSGTDPVGAGSGAGLDTAALAAALAAAAPGVAGTPGASDEPAVAGAPTTAGTAANLLSYFPDGHIVTALIRFDRLRGTEWAAQTEQLLRPLPDYQLLFGARDADILGKLETLVISTPRPRDAAATTLVARTRLSRAALRGALGASAPVTWSVARGGLLGRRTNPRFLADQRVFLSPFPGWFLLAQPGDLGELTRAARGALDAAVATSALPPWLSGIRSIEAESGDKRGPAVVVTFALRGRRQRLGSLALGLGVRSIPTPDRISLAMELVPQGWLVRGNMRFASEADASELLASVQQMQKRIGESRAIQLVIGVPIAHVIASLAFARNGVRVSYASAISIADARAILAAAAQQIDQYFAAAAAPPAP